MLLEYHLTFTVLSFILFFMGLFFLFIWKTKYEWSTLIGLAFMVFNIVISWISILGFHGIQIIELDSTDTFQIYTYPDMWSLHVLPYGMVFISIAIILVAVLMEIGVLFNEATDKGVRLPNRNREFWKKTR